PPTDSEPSALTDRRRKGAATNGTTASRTEASSTIAHRPRRSARRSASRPPTAYPTDSATSTVAIVLAQMIVDSPKYGASNRIAEISAPRLAAPTTKAMLRITSGLTRTSPARADGGSGTVPRGAAPSRWEGGPLPGGGP